MADPELQVADVVPKTNSIRQWADTFPWAVGRRRRAQFCQTLSQTRPRGRHPIPIRVLLALELLKHEVGASDEDICQRLRTDFAVMYACGLDEVQLDSPQEHFVLPETLAQFRSRIDEALMDELLAIQAAAAMDEGLVSPAHLLVDTFPTEQGSQRVTDATTLYKAQKNLSSSNGRSRRAVTRATTLKQPSPQPQQETCKKSCAALAANAEVRAKSS